LILSIPAQYYGKIRKSSRITNRVSNLEICASENKSFMFLGLLKKFMPSGYGVEDNFIKSFKSF